MAKGKNSWTLKELATKNPSILNKICVLLSQGETTKSINEYLAGEQIAPFSPASFTNLKKKIKEANEQEIPLTSLLDKRTKSSQSFLNDENQEKSGKSIETGTAKTQVRATDKWSTEELLDQLINYYHIMQNKDKLLDNDAKIYLKAIEDKSKLFPQSAGYSIELMKQRTAIMQTVLQQTIDSLMVYVPKDKRDEAFSAVQHSINDVKTTLELTQDGKEFINSLGEEKINAD